MVPRGLTVVIMDKGAKEKLAEEAIRVFGKAIWLDNTGVIGSACA
jgi:hypothetical protein